MTRALVPLAEGCEEIEAVVIIDTLRRAQWEVVTVGFHPGALTASRGVRLIPDAEWEQVTPDAFDCIILPGGARGTQNLMTVASLLEAIRKFAVEGKLLAAICAGPLVLQAAGVLRGHTATCHPAVRNDFRSTRSSDRVVVDGNLVTSQGPGTAIEFALALIRLVDGDATADMVAEGLVI